KKFDYSPNVQRFLDHDMASTILKLAKTNPQAVKNLDIYMDGGIRDIFNSAVVNMSTVSRLKAAGMDVKVFDSFWGYSTSLNPKVSSDYDYQVGTPKMDYSRKAMGQVTIMNYGKPDANDREIWVDQDGSHVGSIVQAIERFTTYLTYVGKRWPGLDWKKTNTEGRSLHDKYFSKSLNAWRRYSILLPPGYDLEANKSVKYPVVYLGHGYGMSAYDFAMSGLIYVFNMANGELPKMIVVYPEGKCCQLNIKTGARECACERIESKWQCVDATGNWKIVPDDELDGDYRECNRGSFYTNMVSDKFGSTEKAKEMKYEGSVMDLVEYVDKNFRIMDPADIAVKE
ncbi:MAG: hypothetical protein WC889_19130, partial [Myxococcota bacterium]